VQIDAGGKFGCALDHQEEIACWGLDPLGNGILSPPTGPFTQITSGRWHACALATDQTITCWGENSDAPIGMFTQVAAGEVHTCALTEVGSATCWGGNNAWGEIDVPVP